MHIRTRLFKHSQAHANANCYFYLLNYSIFADPLFGWGRGGGGGRDLIMVIRVTDILIEEFPKI